MSKNLKKAIDELKSALAIKDPRKRKVIISFLSNKKFIYSALREIAKNIINKKIPFNTSQKNKINKHTKTIKKLVSGTDNKSIQRRLVQQSGGFIQWLLPIITSLLNI